METWNGIFRKRMLTIMLMGATFFCPFGYDLLFRELMLWTGSYWTTDLIFYLISALLFICYFYFSNKWYKK
jgi:hypothetical protein